MNRLKTTILALALLLCANVFAQDDKFFIYLCIGQSNMEGCAPIETQDSIGIDDRYLMMPAIDCNNRGREFGKWYKAVPPLCRCYTGLTPVDYFGRTLVDNLPADYRVGVINVAIGGCKIELFMPDSLESYMKTVSADWFTNIVKEYDGNPLARLVECAKLAQKEGVIKGILLHQGESNSGDYEWPNKVKVVYDYLVKELNLNPKEVPLFAGEVVNADQQGICSGVNAIIANLPGTLPNSYVIPSAGVPCGADHLHFSSEGYRMLGRRYAEQALSLMGYSTQHRQVLAQNPVIFADVPDISVLRVGDTYYMSSTTMHMSPGVPIMKSKDLINWEIVSYCYDRLGEVDDMNLDNGKSTYGRGSWASCIRYHNGLFYVSTFAQTTNKTYIFTTDDIEKGEWKAHIFAPAYHDHSLVFDDDGKIYMIFGNGRLSIVEVKPDLSGVVEGTQHVLIENASTPAGRVGLGAEGSQMFKVNGKYYLFNIAWPVGGMRTVLIHRADSIMGPYEGRVAFQDLGVAQGGLVDTPEGKWFAYLFRDYGSVGRIPYLVPVTWKEGWPVIGENGKVPDKLLLPASKGLIPGIVASDEFTRAKNDADLPLVWQWNHNPDNTLWSVRKHKGYLRLTTGRVEKSIFSAKNTLTQRTIGPVCMGETSIDVAHMKEGDFAGLTLFQRNFGWVGVKVTEAGKFIVMMNASTGHVEEQGTIPFTGKTVWLKASCNFENMKDEALFYYSVDGINWQQIGGALKMAYTMPHFMGYRFGLFNYATKTVGGYVDFDYFRIQQ